MWSLGFTASEAYIGTAFSPTDLSLFKATSDVIIEYLDFSKGFGLCRMHMYILLNVYHLAYTWPARG